MRGSLWPVSHEQLRPATSHESLGAEIVNTHLDDLRTDLQKNRSPKKYIDITREGTPSFPGDPDDLPGLLDNSDDDIAEPEPPVDETPPQNNLPIGQ
eukprot:8037727-Karenia_brevis.AAC.1